MSKLSCLQKLQIISDNANHLGNICDFLMDGNTITHLKSTLDYKIPTNKIIAISDAIIVNDGMYDCDNDSSCTLSPIMSTIISDKGKILGQVHDYEITKLFLIRRLILENSTLSAEKVIAYGKNNIIISNKKKLGLNSQSNTKSFTEKEKSTINTIAINSEEKLLKTNISNSYIHYNPIEESVALQVNDYSFLIGRITCKNILTKARKMLIKQHTEITKDTIEVARRYNKLIELTLYSK